MFGCTVAEAEQGLKERFNFLKGKKSPTQEIMESVNDESVCQECFGTGEISTDESDGEGHTMRGVGTRKCECQIRDEDFTGVDNEDR